jgi:hypothetical protein
MKIKILLILVFLVSLSTKAQLTATDDGCFIFVESSSLQKVHIEKGRCALQKTNTTVTLVYTSNNSPYSFSWNKREATAYKGGLDQLYDYLKAILINECGSGASSSIDSLTLNGIDSIISILNSTTDSIYTLQISNGIKQLDGTVDSFNCRSVSFAWRTMATGTATITGSDGTSLIFNPLDELPNWSVSDGNKLGKIYIDATGATGLRIFYTGCENPCFKKIQAIDCTSGQPIQLGDFNDDFNDDFLN